MSGDFRDDMYVTPAERAALDAVYAKLNGKPKPAPVPPTPMVTVTIRVAAA